MSRASVFFDDGHAKLFRSDARSLCFNTEMIPSSNFWEVGSGQHNSRKNNLLPTGWSVLTMTVVCAYFWNIWPHPEICSHVIYARNGCHWPRPYEAATPPRRSTWVSASQYWDTAVDSVDEVSPKVSLPRLWKRQIANCGSAVLPIFQPWFESVFLARLFEDHARPCRTMPSAELCSRLARAQWILVKPRCGRPVDAASSEAHRSLKAGWTLQGYNCGLLV